MKAASDLIVNSATSHSIKSYAHHVCDFLVLRSSTKHEFENGSLRKLWRGSKAPKLGVVVSADFSETTG
jgi:hypothetical protein